MASAKISDLASLSTPDIADLVVVVDVSDATMAATGTNKKTTVAGVLGGAALLAGRSGGQTIAGDTASAGNLTLNSTAHATKGVVYFNGTGGALVNAAGEFSNPKGFADAESFGAGSSASDIRGTAVGSATSVGKQAVAIGYLSSCAGDSAVAIGYSTNCTQPLGVLIGSGGSVTSTRGISIGGGAATGTAYSITIGAVTTSGHSGAVALGGGIDTSRQRELTIGCDTSSGAGAWTGGHRIRFQSTASDNLVHDIGTLDMRWAVSTAASRLGRAVLVTTGFNGDHDAIYFDDTGNTGASGAGIAQAVIPIANVRDAADDTAAAALSPACPVGGLYRTGSTLKIRVS